MLPGGPEWKIDPASPGALMWAKGKLSRLHLVIINPPSQHGCGSGRAPADTARYDAMERNFDLRDRRNSKPAIYTTVSQDLKNQNGSTRQWFRAANAATWPGRGPTALTPTSTTSSPGAPHRAEAARHHGGRARAARVDAGPAGVGVGAIGGVEDGDGEDDQHTELIVTDGKDYRSFTCFNP